MPDRDILLAKMATIQRCLKRIRETTGLDPESLDNIDREDIFVLNLQPLRSGPLYHTGRHKTNRSPNRELLLIKECDVDRSPSLYRQDSAAS